VIRLSPAGRAFNAFFLLLSTAVLYVGFGLIGATILELQLGEVFSRRKTKRMINQLNNHFIVCGLGRVGRGAALELQRTGVPFVVVDLREDRIDWAMKQGMLAVLANATRDETLRGVQVERARGVIAALSSDADNLFLTISAKTLSPNINVSTRANEEEAELKFRRVGADAVIAPFNLTGIRLAQSLLRPHVSQFLDFTSSTLGPNVAIEQVRVAGESGFTGKSLEQLGHLRRELGVMVLAIRDAAGHMTFNPAASHVIQAGDFLIVMGEVPSLRKLEDMLMAA
jgi:voltage-gated potassium channel